MQTKTITVRPEELDDLRAFELKHQAKIVGGVGEGCFGRRRVVLQPVASLEWCIRIWDGLPKLVRFNRIEQTTIAWYDGAEFELHIQYTVPNAEWEALLFQVVVVDHGAHLKASGEYYPLSADSLALYEAWRIGKEN